MTAAAPTRCRVCAADVPPGALRCPNCSAAQGPLDPCPHCKAQAGVSPHAVYRWVCDVCGGPRVPRMDPSIAFSGRELPLLRKADAARKARAGWRAGAIASGLLLPVVVLFFAALLLVFGPGILLIALSLLSVGPVAAFFAYAMRRAGARGREIGPALDAAWTAAATDIAQQSAGALTAAELARKLGVEEPQAEELMALIDVNDALRPRARIAVDKGAPAAVTQMASASPAQIASASPTQIASTAGPTQISSAEEEAALIEQSAAEEEALRKKGSV